MRKKRRPRKNRSEKYKLILENNDGKKVIGYSDDENELVVRALLISERHPFWKLSIMKRETKI